MENPVVSEGLATALYILIPLMIAAIAVWKGERARSQQADGITRARIRRTYCFFMPWAAFVLVASVVGMIAPDVVEVVGIAGGLPAGIFALLAVFHGLMVWRVPLVALLLSVTLLLALVVACSELLPAAWSSAIEPSIIGVAIAYGPIALGVSIRGLLSLRRAVGPDVRET